MHIFAKILGWGQFGIVLGNQVLAASPHGSGWLGVIVSAVVATATHAAASTDGNK